MNGKVLIFSAPSGSGKTTIVKHLLGLNLGLEFSVSATNRPPRGEEIHTKDYYFLSTAEFRDKIARNEFIEWEEVYAGRYYGTLKSEVERIWQKKHHVVFDVDVVGGVNIKKEFGARALSLFIQPPGIAELKKRLIGRGTDSAEEIEKRLAKAAHELTYAPLFDVVIINDVLDKALAETEQKITAFLNQ